MSNEILLDLLLLFYNFKLTSRLARLKFLFQKINRHKKWAALALLENQQELRNKARLHEVELLWIAVPKKWVALLENQPKMAS